MHTQLLKTLGRAAAISAVALAAAISGPAAMAKDKFVFAWPSAINSGVANFTFAKALGFFDEEGLDVELIVLAGSGVIIPQLLQGSIHTAYASLEPIPISRQEGKPNFPIRFAYNYLPRSIWELAVLDDSRIKSFADLKGSTIGFVALTSGNIAMTQAMAQNQGVDWSTVQKMGVGSGVPAFEALRRKQIDALNLWDTMHVALELSGTKIRRIAFPKEYQGLPSHGFPYTNEMIKKRPDLIAKFGRAMSKGAVACQANLEGCIRSFWKEYPTMRPTTGTEEENIKREMAILKPRLENLLYARNDKNMGAFTDKEWQLIIGALKLGGLIDQKANIPTNTLYTNEFVAEYNRFSREDVVKKAKAYK
ncbi:MAG: ABC transporter substrate-binding protein [Xanthobacteraceae bacterium]|nr:ABC transporter substrate-binding protein [Xanthobacteraceae bacterium]MBX3523279.1 ABC transporter substrate-binding protein [Xanthobacteraceae bacterium]MBX3534375.1 ABC transporter substrate-binding protein [Xanthobacteraceae bacterium]MCW5673986.1 ABC transporter substrate-binding protein [Xanthobacteraceae bacterium]MCW5678202.1 ABC transporter substrate-binding protein [Xanthobacteraceae bacterium]